MVASVPPLPRPPRITAWLGAALAALLLATPGACGSTSAAPGGAGTVAATSPADSAASAALIVESDTVMTFRATVVGVAPPRRAGIASARLDALNSSQLRQPIRIEGFGEEHAILVGDILAFFVVNGDLAGRKGETLETASAAAARRLGAALAQRVRLRSPAERWRAIWMALLATATLLVAIALLRWLSRFTVRRFRARSEARGGGFKLGDLDFLDRISTLIAVVARIATRVGALVFVAIWIVYVLGLFPETHAWGVAAQSSLRAMIAAAQGGILRAIPGILAVVLIVFVTRALTHFASEIFAGVERGSVHAFGLHPETAGATKRLVNAALWLFAVVVAYPLLPGSGSDAFKGVSVFLGLMITLGSSGVVGHMMSGLVLVYSRALKPGDYVCINDIEGVVTEVGSLSVKIATPRREEFTIPNAVIVGTTVRNSTRLCHDIGVPLSTRVSIGYDVPWRAVREVLAGAALRTPGVRKDPAPLVQQARLAEFSVEYLLVVRLEDPERRFMVLDVLHQNIQDGFNERGIQIMVPAFESQPQTPLVVPKSKWFAPGVPGVDS